jgi:hypothetical protein
MPEGFFQFHFQRVPLAVHEHFAAPVLRQDALKLAHDVPNFRAELQVLLSHTSHNRHFTFTTPVIGSALVAAIIIMAVVVLGLHQDFPLPFAHLCTASRALPHTLWGCVHQLLDATRAVQVAARGYGRISPHHLLQANAALGQVTGAVLQALLEVVHGGIEVVYGLVHVIVLSLHLFMNEFGKKYQYSKNGFSRRHQYSKSDSSKKYQSRKSDFSQKY